MIFVDRKMRLSRVSIPDVKLSESIKRTSSADVMRSCSPATSNTMRVTSFVRTAEVDDMLSSSGTPKEGIGPYVKGMSDASASLETDFIAESNTLPEMLKDPI